MTVTELGRAIEQRRVERGWTQRDLSVSSGVSLTTISAIERASREHFQTTTLQALDRALGWPLGQAQSILGGMGIAPVQGEAPLTAAEHTVRTLLDVVARLNDDAVRHLIVIAERLSAGDTDVVRIEGEVVESARLIGKHHVTQMITVDSNDARWSITLTLRVNEERATAFPPEVPLEADDHLLLIAHRL